MRIVRGVLFAAFLFVAFVAVALLLMPKERIAKLASTEISKALGRDVQITGDLGISLWPVLGVKTGPVRVAGPDWTDAPLLQAEGLNIGVGAAAALRREVEIKRVELVAPQINLITAKDGRTSWSFSDRSDGGGESAGLRPFSLERAEIRGGTVVIDDRKAGTKERISDLTASIALPELAGPAKLSARGVRGSGALKIDAEAASGRDFITGRLTGVSASLETAGGTARFDGKATRTLEADGQLALKLNNTDAFLRSLGLGGADVPRGLGQSVDLKARMIFSGGKTLNLRGMTLALDQNTLTGDADIRLGGARPKVTAKLNAGALDFTALSNEGGSEGEGDGWSKTPIDAGGLGAVDAEVSLTAASIDAGMIKLGQSLITVALDNSRAVFRLPKAAGYNGQIAGEFVINNRSGLSVGGNLSALQVDAKPLLSDLMGVERLSGKADGFVKFLGVGNTLDAIMNSLSGNGGIAMSNGAISGFDLNALMGTGNGQSGTTIFDKLGASFDMKGGVLSNNDLNMSLPRFTASGRGTVSLGARRIDYLFTPVALKANKGKDLAFPVRIRGPWSKPQILPDLSAAIDLNFKEKKEEVKTKVEDAVKDKIEKELGVTVGDGESVEDAVKKGIENKLKDELLKILE